MGVMEDVTDDLAQLALKLEEQTGDEKVINKIADALGNSSPTMEETFLTAVRIRRAERRARAVIAEIAGSALPAPEK